MTDFLDVLTQAVDSKQKSPSPKKTLAALLEAEKYARRHKPDYQFSQIWGSWQLRFIHGTNQSRVKFASILENGFYLPALIGVKITYSPLFPHQNVNQGQVINSVSVGLVKFDVEGPCQFSSPKNILAFDFLNLTMFVLGAKIFSKDIRGGKNSREKFFAQSISQQAFFSYFLINEEILAARGRGGGLALWKRIDEKEKRK